MCSASTLEPAFIVPSSLFDLCDSVSPDGDFGRTALRKDASLESRSTSAGSSFSTAAGSSPPVSPPQNSLEPSSKNPGSSGSPGTPKLRQQITLMGLPEDDHPMPLNLWNVLDSGQLTPVTPARRQLSLDDCIEEPKVTLSPFKTFRAPPGLSEVDRVPTPNSSPKKKLQVLCLADVLEGQPLPTPPPRSDNSPANLPLGGSPSSCRFLTTAPALDDAQHHGSGICRPCAFFHRKGCSNGLQCSFCHSCGPGEKKRRQKDKLTVQR